jgi:hypothetical protein
MRVVEDLGACRSRYGDHKRRSTALLARGHFSISHYTLSFRKLFGE